MNSTAPKIDDRTFKDMLKQARSMALFYTPEWDALQDKEPGVALLKIYLHLFEQIISRLNQAPDKNLIAFLDMMGIKLLPAQSATGPVTFSLAEGAIENVLVPKGTQLTAQSANDGEEVLFETQNNLLVSAAVLKEVISVTAGKDEIYEHTAEYGAGSPFTIFQGTNKQEHSLYIGHNYLLNQKKPSEIIVTFDIRTGASGGDELEFVWEYWNGTFWVRLANVDPAEGTDNTNRFQKSGAMTLNKKFSGEIVSAPVNKIKNRWIRCRIKSDLTSAVPIELPLINTVRLSVSPEKPFAPDLAFNNDIPIDVNTINVPMLGMKGNIEIINASPQTSPPGPGDNVLYLRYMEILLQEGDILEFNNNIDDPIRKTIKTVDNEYVEFTEPVGLREGDTYDVRMITAIRKIEADEDMYSEPVIRVDSLEGHDISVGSKVYLIGAPEDKCGYVYDEPEPEDVYVSPPIQDVEEKKYEIPIQIKGEIDSYIEGDIIKIIPKIKPFGELPTLFDTFYIASDEAFSKNGATITLHFESSWKNCDADACSPQDLDEPNPVLSWEYWNGISWRGIRVVDGTKKFRTNGDVSFACPDDIEKIKVNGEEKYWIRVRIIDGDYGKEIVVKNVGSGWFGMPGEVRAIEGKVHYPIITELTINYEEIKREPEYCLTYNNLNFVDCTEVNNDEYKFFAPFELLPEQYSGIFLGFNNPLISGPLQILFSLDEQVLEDDDQLKIAWFYWNGSQWTSLNVVDKTENLTKIGIIQWIGGRDFKKYKLFGKDLYWMKASVIKGEFIEQSEDNSEKPINPEIKGIFPNTTYTFQASFVENEILGSSDFTASQEFFVSKAPIISQQAWVMEPNMPTDEEKKTILAEEGEDAIEETKDETGETEKIWIRWQEVADFDDSDTNSRHYIVDQRLGKIQFGDGVKGKIPPKGENNVKASYKYGGGESGNVIKGAISGLKNAIPFVKGVANPLAADGGAETETLDWVLLRGPQRLKNRDRAVTAEDFKWLAKNASRKVARAKCLTNIDDDENYAPGWVTVLVVPNSSVDKPESTQQLLKVIKEQLEKQCANTVSSPDHICVRDPKYVQVVVEATIIPAKIDVAATVEQAVHQTLKRYIHPLTGGPDKNGWEFGKDICLSDIYALVEGIKDVDYVEKIVLYADGIKQKQGITIDKFALPYSGDHKISIKLQATEVSSSEKLKSECIEL